jgi:murein DD-endopeptidase MepM/ murein hydrolase activator NlpD
MRVDAVQLNEDKMPREVRRLSTFGVERSGLRQRFQQIQSELTARAVTEPTTYTVARGDNLSSIVLRHLEAQGASPSRKDVYDAVQRVAQANGLKNADLIFAGQELDLAAVAAASEPEVSKVELAQLAEPKASPLVPLPQPESPVPVASVAPVEEAQGLGGRVLPVKEALANLKNLIHGSTPAVAETKLSEPVHDAAHPWARLVDGTGRLTSGYGLRKDPFSGRLSHHDGIDIAAKKGTSIRPVKDGHVVFSGWQRGYGRMVIVRHNDGTESVYGHTSKNLVHVGDDVTLKTPIAEVGSTGRSTGTHLHFELRMDGKSVDPLPSLRKAPESFHVAQTIEGL